MSLRSQAKRILPELSDHFPLAIHLLGASGVAIIAVAYAELFRGAEHLALSMSEAMGWYFLFVGPPILVLAWALVHFVSPMARGSGIPQTLAAIRVSRGDGVSQLVGIRVGAVKLLSSLLAVLGGAAVGREGPTVQIAASWFRFLGRLAAKYKIKLDEVSCLVAGAAGGLAAAFNTPLGGIVFAIEELAFRHFPKLKINLLIAVLVAGVVAQLFIGRYLYLGYPRVGDIGLIQIFQAFAVALIIGMAAGLFTRILLKGLALRERFTNVRVLALVALCGGVVLVVFQNFLSPYSLGSGRESLERLLFSLQEAPEIGEVLARFLSPLVSYLTGVGGGIFAPSLAAGASMGSFLAHLVDQNHTALFALCGMTAFLSGVTRAPFTSFVLVLEMTDRHSAVFPLILSSVIGLLGAYRVDRRSFYGEMAKSFLKNISPRSET